MLQPHTRAFLWLGSLFGLAYCLAAPPFEVPDENAHFLRAYQVSAGDWRATSQRGHLGGAAPRSAVDMIDALLEGVPFHPETRVGRERFARAWSASWDSPLVFAEFSGAALYSPAAYLFSAPALLAARLVSSRPLVALYAGRLANLAGALVVSAAALECLPALRGAFTVLALLPMAAFQRSSLSPDAALNALALLLAAMVLRFCARERGWDYEGRRRALYLAASAALALTKHSYALLPFLLLAVPSRRMRRPKAVELAILAAVALLPEAVWLALNHGMLAASGGANPALQAAFARAHPARAVAVALAALGVDAPTYLAQWAGVLGYLDTPLPAVFPYAALALLFAVWLAERGGAPRLAPAAQLTFLGVSAATLAMIVVPLYFEATPPGAMYVDGIQGRYLIPVVPLLLAALDGALPAARLRPARERLARLVALGGGAAAMALGLFALWSRYYAA